jgi:hypothetical protein
MKYCKDQQKIDAMISDYLTGLNARQIADKYNYEHNYSLINWLKREAKKVNNTGKRKKNESSPDTM